MKIPQVSDSPTLQIRRHSEKAFRCLKSWTQILDIFALEFKGPPHYSVKHLFLKILKSYFKSSHLEVEPLLYLTLFSWSFSRVSILCKSFLGVSLSSQASASSEAGSFCSPLLQWIQMMSWLLFLYSSETLLWRRGRQRKLRWQSFQKIKQACFHQRLPHDYICHPKRGGPGKGRHCRVPSQLRKRQRTLKW